MSTVQTHALEGVLDVLMDARSAGSAQARAMYHPERASLAGYVESLPRSNPVRKPMIRSLHRVMLLASEQAGYQQQATGIVEALCPNWQAARRDLTVKSIAARLRPALAIMADPRGHDVMDFVAAVRTVDEVVAVVPPHELFTASVRRELGPGKFAHLRRVARRPTGGALQEATA
jgi:hypothetical protein